MDINSLYLFCINLFYLIIISFRLLLSNKLLNKLIYNLLKFLYNKNKIGISKLTNSLDCYISHRVVIVRIQ